VAENENADVKEKKAVTKVSLGALTKLLRLPPGVVVRAVAVTEEDQANGSVAIYLAGEGLPERCTTGWPSLPETVGLVYRVTAIAMLEKIE